jgi:hypothetical protein
MKSDLLIYLHSDGLKAEIKGTNQRLDQAYNQQVEYHREKVAFVLTDQQNRCHQAFKTSNYEEQKNINPRKVEGTCLWALRSPEYTRWSESSCNDLLWVSADPGCGKSVLSRSIIEDFLDDSRSDVTICYFFFKDNDEQNRLDKALCSVLHQLFSQQPRLLHHAIASWNQNGEKLQQEVDELWRVFVTAASSDESCKTICIFDALDECRDIDLHRLIDKLRFFHRQSISPTPTTYLKFLLTSRPYDHIQDQFRTITNTFPHLHLKGEEQNDLLRKEIDLVVKMRVEELAETAELSSDIQQRLEQKLLRMEHRTYLWLHLAMEDVRSAFEDSLRPVDVEESIQMIPPSVYDAYARILCRVPSRQLDTVRKALQIIVAARRPLTTAEMAIALGVAIWADSRTIAEARLDSSQIAKKLRRLCGLFVFIKDSKIYLIHQTAREFLVAESASKKDDSVYSWSLSEAEDQMGSVCLRYLSMEDLETGEESPDTHDFLEYSAVHWPDHVRNMALTSSPRIVNQLHQLYDTSGKPFPLWFPIFWKISRPYDPRVPTVNSLHIAAFTGHEQEVEYLLEDDPSIVNMADSTSTYPIMWASLNGHREVVRMLLEKGADVNAQGGDHSNALGAACSEGHDKIVQMLLERGADVNAKGGDALRAACSGGHGKIVQMLLKQGADIDARGGRYGNALQAARSGGHADIVRTLLKRGADQSTPSFRFTKRCK